MRQETQEQRTARLKSNQDKRRAKRGVLFSRKERAEVNAAQDENCVRLAAKPRKAQPRSMRRLVLRTSKGWQPVIVYTSGGWGKTLSGVRIDLATR